MISNILDYAGVRKGELSLNFKAEDPQAILRNAVQLHTAKANNKGIGIEVYDDKKIPPFLKLD